MLELRPGCEHCNSPLPPESTKAMICSFECTFCIMCVELLENVCPNCGGGFYQRPVRPSQNLKNGNYLGKYPAGTRIVHKPVDLVKHKVFAANIVSVPAEKR